MATGTPLFLNWCYKETQLKFPSWEVFVLTHRVKARPRPSSVVVLIEIRAQSVWIAGSRKGNCHGRSQSPVSSRQDRRVKMWLQRPALAQGTRKQKSHAPHPERLSPILLGQLPARMLHQLSWFTMHLSHSSAQAQAGQRVLTSHLPLPHSSLEYSSHCQQGPLGNQLMPINLPQIP